MYGSSRRNRHEEYKSIMRDKIEEAEWKYLDVSEHWQQMKNIMMETAQDMECQKVHTDIRKHGSRMMRFLKGKRR